MRKDYNNIDEAIADFKSEFIFTDLAEDLIDSLFITYGEDVLSFYTSELDFDNITIHEMNEVKSDIEDKYIISVCARNDIKSDKIKLYELFSNLDCLIGGMYPEDDIIEMLIKKEWIDVFKIWEYPKRNYWVVEKSLFFKGCRWNECPKPIQDHFIKLKGE